MKKLILTLLPVVLATVLYAQMTSSEMVTITVNGNKFTQENHWSGDVLKRVTDISKASSSGDLFFCDSVYGYMFNPLMDSSLNYKSIYTYDVNGNQSTYTDYIFDNICNNWIMEKKDTMAYNNMNKLTFKRRYFWDTNIKKLSSGWGYDITFDANGNQIKQVDYNLDTTNNQFVFSHKVETSYHSPGESDSSLHYNWNPVIGNWDITFKWKSTYNLDNVLISSNHYSWDTIDNLWINVEKRDYGYDSAGNMALEMSCNWDKNTSQWINANKIELTTNEYGMLTVMSSYGWDVDAEKWVGKWKIEEIYDEEGNRVTHMSYNWNMTISQWVYDYRYNEGYNANGKVVLALLEMWDSMNNEWIGYSKDEYYFEESGLLYLRIFSSLIDDHWYLGSKYYSYNSIHGLTDLVKPAQANSLVIYPNPAKEWINILSNDPLSNIIQLYNYNGQLLKTVIIEPGLNTINISNLESGLYFFKILSQQPSDAFKIIKVE